MTLVTANNIARTQVTENIITNRRCMIAFLVVLPPLFLFAS
jgi:hypothetical protein